MKYYAVKNGYVPGIYNTWEECKSQVEGFNKAIYKSFNNLEDAKSFINDSINIASSSNAVAYVDGSFNISTFEYSFGAVLILGDSNESFKKKYVKDDYSCFRNVAGEVKGAAFIINYAFKKGIKELDLFYDYEGIEKWYNKKWKANNDLTKSYIEFSNSMKNNIKVNFIKVKSHSNDFYNDMVDKLAKEALGIS